MEPARKFKIIVNSKECGTCSGATPSAVAKKVVKKLCGTSSKVVRFSLKECKRGCERVCGPYQGRMEKLDRPYTRSGKKITHRVVCEKVRKMRGGRELVSVDFKKTSDDGDFKFVKIGGKPYIFFGYFAINYIPGYRYVIFNNEIFGNNKTISIMGIKPNPIYENGKIRSTIIKTPPIIIPKNITLNINSNENIHFSEILTEFLKILITDDNGFHSVLYDFFDKLTKLYQELNKEEHTNDYKTIKKYLEILLVGVLPMIIGNEPINNSQPLKKFSNFTEFKKNSDRTKLFETAESYIKPLEEQHRNNYEEIKKQIESLKKGDIMKIFDSFFSNSEIQERIKKNQGYKMPQRGTLEEDEFKNISKIQGKNIFMYCKNLLLFKLEEARDIQQQPNNNGQPAKNGNGNRPNENENRNGNRLNENDNNE